MPPRNYSGAELLRMQREAELRVQGMRNHARNVAREGEALLPPDHRNWSTTVGRSRQLPSQPLRPPRSQIAPGYEAPHIQGPPPAPPQEPQQELRQEAPQEQAREAPREPRPEEATRTRQQGTHGGQPPEPPPKAEGGTILNDVIGALGLEEDTLLIIGLLLMLINQRSDTTLLLALAYLLI